MNTKMTAQIGDVWYESDGEGSIKISIYSVPQSLLQEYFRQLKKLPEAKQMYAPHPVTKELIANAFKQSIVELKKL